MKSLAQMQTEVVANCKDKGWYDDTRTFGEDIALLHSEVSEMLEAFRSHGTEDATQDTRRPCEHSVTCQAPEHTYMIPGKPEGIGSEAADVLIRLLDTCERYGIRLEEEYERKATYNRERPYRHGGKAL